MKRTVSIHELINITNLIYNHLLESGVNEVELELGYYWSINDYDIKYNVELDREDVIKEISIGNLFEDWDDLLKMKEDSEKIISYDLTKLAEILTYIGSKVFL